MKYYGYSVGPAPTFTVILPPGMPDDDPAAYAQACRLANDHRMAVWRRLQAKRERLGHGAPEEARHAAAEEADARHDRGRRHRLAGVPGQPGRRREVDRQRPGARRPGPGAGRARPPGRDGGARLRDHGRLRGGRNPAAPCAALRRRRRGGGGRPRAHRVRADRLPGRRRLRGLRRRLRGPRLHGAEA